MNRSEVRFRSSLCAFALVVSAAASASVTFTFDYTDAPGTGFNVGGTLSAERKGDLALAASYISSVLGPSYTATIDLIVNGGSTDPTFLASAGSNYSSTYSGPGFGLEGDVMSKILTGVDPGGAAPDGQINWNFADYSWGYDAVVPSGQYDFLSTATHELTHAIGFASLVAQNGDSPFGDPPGTASEFGHFDQFLADASGRIISAGGVLDGNRWSAAEVSNGGLFFDGPNAIAANGGQRVQLYSPTTYEPGSSVSHLNDNVYPSRIYLMDAATDTGTGAHVYTPLEIGMLQDLGYTKAAQPVPEPASLCALGLGAVAALRRRKRA